LPWIEEDWRTLSDAEQQSRTATLLQADAARGFDLAAPPAMRIALLRTSDASWQLVWSTHHLCIDGWSWPVFFRDVSRAYAALENGTQPALEAPIPFRDYVEWLATAAPKSETFWRERLRGVIAPTPLRLGLGSESATNATANFVDTSIAIDADTTAALRNLARREQVTPSVVMSAAWALLLAHYAASDDVVLGASFSGRPGEIRGIEALVGACVNNLPVRIAIDPGQRLAAWLTDLQLAQIELAQHQYTPLQEIQQCSQVPGRYRLFDSLVVFQNYQIDEDARRLGANVGLTLIAAPEATNYPLTLAVTMADEMRIRLIHQPALLDAADVLQFAADLGTILRAIARATGESVGDLLALLPETLRGRAKTVAATKTTGRADYAAPASESERVIAALWQQLFGVDRISLDDNFFELGGHSLLLVRAHAALKEKLQTDIPIVALLQYPTIRSLARHLADGRAVTPSPDAAIDRARKQREAYARQRNLTGKR
jgi:acyl carrier protein